MCCVTLQWFGEFLSSVIGEMVWEISSLSPLPDKMTYLGQKFCLVVYPAESSSKGSEEEGEEMIEARSPLSKEDGEKHKSEDC